MMKASKTGLYRDFIWRRLHSLVGLWLVVYISIHLFTNSQAALLIGGDGKGFIHSVNGIHELPYLPIIEIAILLLPFLIHLIWGLQRLWTAKLNACSTDGSSPALPEFKRNQCFTWQRITSWILIVGIAAHVIHMRLLQYPAHATKNSQDFYMVPLSIDDGLYTVAQRLDVTLYSPAEVIAQLHVPNESNLALDGLGQDAVADGYLDEQKAEQAKKWSDALTSHPIHEGQVIAVTKDFGTADLLMLRNVFKSPLMILLYSFLVIAACFHGFNGLWTFLITWGVTLSERSQKVMKTVTWSLMFFVTFLGLCAIWGTYWINLRY